jgi:hypothetical protein
MLARISDRNPSNCVDSQSKDILLSVKLLNSNDFPRLRELTCPIQSPSIAKLPISF